MYKYNYEFKKAVVTAYLLEEGGKRFLAKKFGIANPQQIIEWVKCYENFGDEGLKRSRQNAKYSFEKKLFVVELYLSSEISYQDLALQEGISNPSLVASWVNRYRVDGPDALKSHKKGRKQTLDKSKISPKPHEIEERVVDTSAEHVKELEDELLKLRIENAFLKELRRLRLEDEAKMRERHSSSTASGESLD